MTLKFFLAAPAMACLLGRAAALEPPGGAAAAADSAPCAMRYEAQALLAGKYIPAVLARQDRLGPEKFERALADIAELNEKLIKLLGPGALSEIEAEETAAKAAAEAEPAAAPEAALAEIRRALQTYYGDHNAVFPKSLSELVPAYLSALPRLHLAGHKLTGDTALVDSKEYDSDPAAAVTDSGGWLYFSSTQSANWGMLTIDCSHAEGAPNKSRWCDY